jgi:hypothetical protein
LDPEEFYSIGRITPKNNSEVVLLRKSIPQSLAWSMIEIRRALPLI